MSPESRNSRTRREVVAMQWFCKHISTATRSRDHGNRYTNATIEEQLEAVFYVGSSPRPYKEDNAKKTYFSIWNII
jgi:hypothetical protein